VNEIDDYWRARYLTAPEAAWRILGYHITRKEPAVTPLPVHLEAEIRHHHQYRSSTAEDSGLSALIRYFLRPIGTYIMDDIEYSFENLTYIEYYRYFRLQSFNESLPNAPTFIEHGVPAGER
jgi:hypothetical protein